MILPTTRRLDNDGASGAALEDKIAVTSGDQNDHAFSKWDLGTIQSIVDVQRLHRFDDLFP
jgi:hypothetical protein